MSLGGVMMSVLLLSLGAPFWFNTLSGLLRLRSVVARQDDADRTERQMDTSRGKPAAAPGAPAAGGAPASRAVAERRGDVEIVG